MPVIARRSTFRVALAALGFALAAAHLPASATTDLPIVVEVCPKEGGRDPSLARMTHSCGVWSPDDFAAVPSWQVLQLLFVDPNPAGAGVVATLKCMDRRTGAVSNLATVRSTYSPTAAAARSVRLPAPLNFARCGYFVQVVVDQSTQPSRALMVTLRR